MSKIFNVSADCKPNIHYMVDISERLCKIKELVDRGEYFTINRARQYGKTTTLRELKKYLQDEYLVISMDFQKLDAVKFRDGNIFSITFASYFLSLLKNECKDSSDKMTLELKDFQEAVSSDSGIFSLFDLFIHLSWICKASDKRIVMMIDEVDSAANNQVFLDFLAQLRGYYIDRDEMPIFHSVILASVYDIKNLKVRLRPDEDRKTNSPWNIAADFDVAMSFSKKGIAGMLSEYEEDHHTEMNIDKIAGMIYDYTSGYPFLVSRICKLIDEKVAGSEAFPELSLAWSVPGFLEAVRILLSEKNTLFESLTGKLSYYEDLRKVLYEVLFGGRKIMYNPDNAAINIATMFGFVKNTDGILTIANRVFETRLYNYFLTSDDAQNSEIFAAASDNKSQYIKNGHLDMDMIMRKYVEHFDSIYGDQREEFDEEEGRRRFLLYIRPIINGTGNYYIESETRNSRRMDVVVDYLGERFVIELKIWRGNSYHERGEQQLSDYLNYFHLKKGYMLSYNFNNKKEIGVKELTLGDKILVEAVV